MNEIFYKKINCNLLKKNKNEFKELLNIVLEKNKIRSDLDTINETFDNMIKFTENDSAIIIGAFKDDKLIGFIWGYKVTVNKETRLHINYFVVYEKYRRQGIGNKLINNLYEIAKKENIKILELMVTAENEIATNFYKEQGFEIERIKLCKNI